MNKLRWTMDGGFWDVDVSTAVTLDGLARPVPGNPTIPLGLSRGVSLSRPKQIDFFQRFMAMPFVPSFAGAGNANGFYLQRVFSFPFGEHWFKAQNLEEALKSGIVNRSQEIIFNFIIQFVEGMAPVFSRSAWHCAWHLIQNDLVHGWGMDMKLGYCAQGTRTKNVGVVDSEYSSGHTNFGWAICKKGGNKEMHMASRSGIRNDINGSIS